MSTRLLIAIFSTKDNEQMIYFSYDPMGVDRPLIEIFDKQRERTTFENDAVFFDVLKAYKNSPYHDTILYSKHIVSN